MNKLLVSVISCVAAVELQHQACEVACRRSGYDGGRYGSEKCYCYDVKEYAVITEKRLIINGAKHSLGTEPEEHVEKKKTTSYYSSGSLDFLDE